MCALQAVRALSPAIGTLLILVGCAVPGTPGEHGVDPVQGALGLTDQQFGRSAAVNEDLAVDLISQSDFAGLLLDAPRRSSVDRLSLIGVRASSIHDNLRVSLNRRAIVVALAPSDDTVHAATVFRVREDWRPPTAPASAPQGRTVKAFQFLLRDRIDDLPEGHGMLHSLLLLFDQRSNMVDIQIDGGRDADSTRGAEEALPKYPPRIYPPVEPRAKDHPYRKGPDSPTPTRDLPIVLAAGPASMGVVRGSFAIPLRDADRVRPLPGPPGSQSARDAIAAGWTEVGDPQALAVVPITLLMTGERDAQPILLSLHVPIYERAESPDTGNLGESYFAVDLAALAGSNLQPQRYAVWAFSRLAISNPVVIAVGAPPSQPP